MKPSPKPSQSPSPPKKKATKSTRRGSSNQTGRCTGLAGEDGRRQDIRSRGTHREESMPLAQTVHCDGCGAPLQNAPAAHCVTCRHCAAELEVERTLEDVYTQVRDRV